MKYKFSVIIPHYNSHGKLVRLLESIPVREDIEIIVVDDQSTDNTIELCINNVLFSRVLFCSAITKVFAGGARNIGISYSQGEYLLFADSDDYFSDGAFQVFDQHCNNNIDLIIFMCESFIESTGKRGTRDYSRNQVNKLNRLNAALSSIPPWAKLIRRDLVINGGVYFSEVIAANDVVFSVKSAFIAKSIKVVNQVVYMYSENPDSLCGSLSLEKAFSRIYEQQKRLKIAKYYSPGNYTEYCIRCNLLPMFKTFSLKLESKEFDNTLRNYKNDLGFFIVVLAFILDKIPFAHTVFFKYLNLKQSKSHSYSFKYN